MYVWSDSGIVLSSKKHGEKYKIVDIFTRNHGKFSAMVSISKTNKFAQFSTVDIDYSSKTEGSLGFWRLRDEKQNWIFSMESENHILVCQSICFLLSRILPYAVPHENIFDFTEYIALNLLDFSGDNILKLYAYFEFILLDDIGFGMSLDDCCSIDSKSIRALWKRWKGGGLFFEELKIDIKNSLKLTGSVIEKNLSQIDNYFRSSVIRLV